jgi:signal transduction histidine kinase
MSVVIIVMCGAYAAAHVLTAVIFSVTGRPSETLGHVASGMVGVIIIFALMQAVHVISHGGALYHRHGELLWTETMDALDRISRGDFDVFIKPEKFGPFSDFVDRINKMALELGSMEELRQEFISNVSHEIQSPLTSISGFAALLKNGSLTQEQRNHYIEIIETESRRLSSLSENLLKLSSLETGRDSFSFTEYRLDEQIENIALMLEPQWGKKDLSVEAELEKISLSGDSDLLSQVWINLLYNAIKFTQPGGKIMIALRQEGDDIRCDISDTGIGIAPESQPHVFERFYKADKARDRSLGGNGLGLSIVKKIVELHGGHIELDSAPGLGTTFRVYLPRLLSV